MASTIPLPLTLKQRRGTDEPQRERKRAPKQLGVRTTPSKSRDYVKVADRYVDQVLAGKIIACSWVTKACQRYRRMRGKTSVANTRFLWSPHHVNDVCSFIERLPHVEGRWSTATIKLEPWQIWMLAACYGFRRKDGGRLVSNVFFQVGRKSAKSTLVAAAALYHLAKEHEPGAQVIAGASTGAQARIVFGVMQRMVKRSAWLRELGFVAWANAVTLDDEDGGGNAKPINAKSSTQDGLNPSFISLDESHAQTFELFDVLKSAQGARSDSMLMAPTTAGYNLTSVGYALRSTAMKILDGVIEADHTFCVLYELDEADDWRDEKVWRKSLPMIGITPTLDYVRKYCLDAQQTPGLQGEFEVKMANRWLFSSSTWLPIAKWNACATQVSIESFAGERCWMGVDLAERDDIAAIALCFKRDDLIYTFVRGYLPELVVQDRSRAVPEYKAWVQSGELVTTPGNMTDYSVIEADLREFCDRFDVQAIVIERFGALNLAANLANSGLPARIESKNPKVFTSPAKELEARIVAGKLRHDGSSFLTWQISNACVQRRRDGSLLPAKENPESPNKIDAVDAICLALSALLDEPDQTEPTIHVLELSA
jgi:phage terminase large subunit-like protein